MTKQETNAVLLEEIMVNEMGKKYLPNAETLNPIIRRIAGKYAQQEAIEFAEWIAKSPYFPNTENGWTNANNVFESINHEELFNKYLTETST